MTAVVGRFPMASPNAVARDQDCTTAALGGCVASSIACKVLTVITRRGVITLTESRAWLDDTVAAIGAFSGNRMRQRVNRPGTPSSGSQQPVDGAIANDREVQGPRGRYTALVISNRHDLSRGDRDYWNGTEEPTGTIGAGGSGGSGFTAMALMSYGKLPGSTTDGAPRSIE